MTSKLDPFERPAEFREQPEAPYFPRFIEKLLLAVIDAYRPEGSEEKDWQKVRQRRLRAAIKALFGRDPRAGPIEAFDSLALAEMAKAVMFDRTVADFVDQTGTAGTPVDRSKIPGDRVLARARRTGKDTNAEDRLRKSFRKHRDYLQAVCATNFNLEEAEMLDDLFEIARVFRKYNIAMEINAGQLGMLSFVIQSLPSSGA